MNVNRLRHLYKRAPQHALLLDNAQLSGVVRAWDLAMRAIGPDANDFADAAERFTRTPGATADAISSVLLNALRAENDA